MRKSIGILIFVLFICSTQITQGDDWGGSAGGDLVVLLFQLLAPESWQGDCDLYYHPGELFYEKNFKNL